MFRVQNRAIRKVLRWQMIGTLIAAALGEWLVGFHGAVSLLLGGGIGIIAGVAFDFVASRGRRSGPIDAGAVVFKALQAEAVKILVMIALLWLVLALYKEVSKVLFVAAAIVSMLSLSSAFFVREE